MNEFEFWRLMITTEKQRFYQLDFGGTNTQLLATKAECVKNHSGMYNSVRITVASCQYFYYKCGTIYPKITKNHNIIKPINILEIEVTQVM